MWKTLRPRLTRNVQKLFWVYLVDNFIIRSTDAVKKSEPKIACKLVPIMTENCGRVTDFREKDRVEQYREKLSRDEVGFFAEHAGMMVGSIWASVNKQQQPKVVRGYFMLMPNEGLIHDIVTDERWRGMGIGAFMVSEIVPVLMDRYRLQKITIDVSVKNRASLRMMSKTGIRVDHTMLNVSASGKLILHLVLRQYA
jgi:ribosomal protein S18 acetylase RimI-like enzyme